MNRLERRALQVVVAVLALVPLSAGLQGVIEGPAATLGDPAAGPRPVDLDSHYRYLSGLLLGLGLLFLSCIPGIERKGTRFRLAAAVVFVGGLGRALSLALHGAPTWPHLVGLGLELAVVPALAVWQARVARSAPS